MSDLSGISEAFVKAVELAAALGAKDISKLPGCWSHQVDDHWKIDLNGKDTPIHGIPPFHIAIEYNGWPAGILSPVGGLIAAGVGANETTFIRALDKAISRATDKA